MMLLSLHVFQHCGYLARPPTFTRFFGVDPALQEALPPKGERGCEVFELYATLPVQPWGLDMTFHPIF